jgi:NAD(P)H-flavin reductase
MRFVDPMVPRRYRVERAWDELANVRSVELSPVEGVAAPFDPGQFNMLYAFGVGEIAISISGDGANPERLVHTTRAVGAVSTALTRLNMGDMLGVRGPFGKGWPVATETGRHVVIVAGGLGLAPLRPAIYHVLRDRDRYAGLTMIYGSRSPDDMLYGQEVHGWKSRFDVDVHVTVDHAIPGWTGRVGVVTNLFDRALARLDPASLSVFICGPEIMMRFSVTALANLGIPQNRMWISMERNMKCAVGFCGHCQLGPEFVCRDGPVFRLDRIAPLIARKEL